MINIDNTILISCKEKMMSFTGKYGIGDHHVNQI